MHRRIFHRRMLTVAAALTVGAASILPGQAPAQSEDFTPAVVYDMGGKFDKSFNEGVYNGMERFREETGIDYREFEVTNPSQREQALRNMARRGADIVIAVGFAQASALERVAPDFPDTKFTIIDGVVEASNVQSVLFEEHQGSFLVGMLAAMKAEEAVGFVGGMDIPLISKFACGYEQGVKYVDQDMTVYKNMTGNTPDAWNNPARGKELALSQFDRGADVVFHAAGGTGLGVIEAAEEEDELAIGVDSNQNYLAPGHVLTSMLKRVDVAAYDALMAAREGSWESGITRLGLAENGVDWALDEHNRSLVTEAMTQRVQEARQAIVNGELSVHDYTANNECTY
jgi:basic membrane protein A